MKECFTHSVRDIYPIKIPIINRNKGGERGAKLNKGARGVQGKHTVNAATAPVVNSK